MIGSAGLSHILEDRVETNEQRETRRGDQISVILLLFTWNDRAEPFKRRFGKPHTACNIELQGQKLGFLQKKGIACVRLNIRWSQIDGLCTRHNPTLPKKDKMYL